MKNLEQVKISMKTVLVTGGLGYLGSKVCERLKKEGYEVRIFCHRTRNAGLDGFKHFYGDVLEMDSILKASRNCEFIVHCAALNEVECRKNPNRALEINAIGTRNMLEAALRMGVRRFIYISTFHVYGKANGRIDEKTLPEPRDDYSISHYAAEQYCRQYNGLGLECVILRVSNAYGAPVNKNIKRWTLLINNLCMQCVNNNSIILKSPGCQKRDFISLSDISSGVSLVMKKPKNALSGRVYNLGGENALSLVEVAKEVASTYSQMHGKPIKVESPHKGKSEKLFFDISMIKKIGYRPKSNFREEIRKTLEACSE
ncbi:NAD(P)-dependent oxidoreductase [Candidatus Woesearchaeota archaeon]|nr:NAD(P)-dependent oxidoreductase [Candidatus Woesearchaeota archaeon]